MQETDMMLLKMILLVHVANSQGTERSTSGMKFQEISNPNKTENIVLHEGFHQCGADDSCNYVAKSTVTGNYIKYKNMGEIPGERSSLIIWEKIKEKNPNTDDGNVTDGPTCRNGYVKIGSGCQGLYSCHEIHKHVAKVDGYYTIVSTDDETLKVYCDMSSEPTVAWTLIASWSLANNTMYNIPFWQYNNRYANSPNWKDYRLSKSKMAKIRSVSTHWRATCSFPLYRGERRDYIKASLSTINILQFAGDEICVDVVYCNVRGKSGTRVAFWQKSNMAFHTSTDKVKCGFNAMQGSIPDEDNFGSYKAINPQFRCSSDSEATTNYWFGRSLM